MFQKIYLNILTFFINILDRPNKKKIIFFFKSKFNNKKLKIVDVGAHKGETIELFTKNFSIEKLYSIEPNHDVYIRLINKSLVKNLNTIEIFNNALGEKNEKKNLNILIDTSSSTLQSFNEKSVYFQRKKKILNPISNKSIIKKKIKTNVLKSSDFFFNNSINNVDILKIDTEGYEYNVLCGLSQSNLQNIKYIYFEHHYDLMITKNYKFDDINTLLKNNNFKPIFKTKMSCRKTFEYIYQNERLS